MTQLSDLRAEFSGDSLDGFETAINNYDPTMWGRHIIGERIPLDALVFSQYQTPYLTLEEYEKKRCNYDPETNEWLVHYVFSMSQDINMLPRIIVHVTKDGVALVDGCHRVSALLMFTNAIGIEAWVIHD